MDKRAAILPAAALAALLAACEELAPPPDKLGRNATQPLLEAPQSESAPPLAPPASPATAISADMELSRRVKQKLEAGQGSNAIPSSGHVEVAAAAGVVTLYGTVDAPSEKEHAALIALGVEGVRSVINNLVVVRGS